MTCLKGSFLTFLQHCAKKSRLNFIIRKSNAFHITILDQSATFQSSILIFSVTTAKSQYYFSFLLRQMIEITTYKVHQIKLHTLYSCTILEPVSLLTWRL